MSFIDESQFDNVVEPDAAPEGQYDLVISGVTKKESRKGSPMLEIFITFEGPGSDQYKGFNHYMMLPDDRDEERTANFKALQRKRFIYAWDVPVDGGQWNHEDLIGLRANLNVGVRTLTSQDGEDFEVNELRLPRLPKNA